MEQDQLQPSEIERLRMMAAQLGGADDTEIETTERDLMLKLADLLEAHGALANAMTSYLSVRISDAANRPR